MPGGGSDERKGIYTAYLELRILARATNYCANGYQKKSPIMNRALCLLLSVPQRMAAD